MVCWVSLGAACCGFCMARHGKDGWSWQSRPVKVGRGLSWHGTASLGVWQFRRVQPGRGNGVVRQLWIGVVGVARQVTARQSWLVVTSPVRERFVVDWQSRFGVACYRSRVASSGTVRQSWVGSVWARQGRSRIGTARYGSRHGMAVSSGLGSRRYVPFCRGWSVMSPQVPEAQNMAWQSGRGWTRLEKAWRGTAGVSI